MAVTIQSVTPPVYDPSLDFKSEIELLGLALSGNAGAAAKVCRDGADFLVQARSDASDNASVIELMTARGVPFPAGFMRVIEWDVYATGDAATEKLWMRRFALVVGAATPTLIAGGTLLGGPGAVTGAATQQNASSLGAGITGPASVLSVGAGVVNISVVTTLAEPVNWTLRVRVGKLIPTILGV